VQISKVNKLEIIYRARKFAKNLGLTRNPNSSSYVEEYVGLESKKSMEEPLFWQNRWPYRLCNQSWEAD